jgi:hypothetical protein
VSGNLVQQDANFLDRATAVESTTSDRVVQKIQKDSNLSKKLYRPKFIPFPVLRFLVMGYEMKIDSIVSAKDRSKALQPGSKRGGS